MNAEEERILARSLILGSLVPPTRGDVKARRGAVLGQAQLTLEIFLQFSHLHLLHGFQSIWRGSKWVSFFMDREGISGALKNFKAPSRFRRKGK